MADLSPAEKAAQELYPHPHSGIPGDLSDLSSPLAYQRKKERAAYIRGDADGYKRAIEACADLVDGLACINSFTQGITALETAAEAIRALAAGKE